MISAWKLTLYLLLGISSKDFDHAALTAMVNLTEALRLVVHVSLKLTPSREGFKSRLQ